MPSHRYWRIVCVRNKNNNNVSIGEVELRESVGGSDVTGSGTASASDTGYGEVASYAFDNNTATPWTVPAKSPPVIEWLQYDFGSGNDKDIVQFAITSRNDAYYYHTPTVFLLQYSDDASSWVTSCGISLTSDWAQNEQRVFTVGDYAPSGSGDYRYYRLYVVKNRDDTACGISEIELRETAEGSDQTGSGTATSSSQYNEDYAASKAVDNDADTEWASGDLSTPHWWKYDFGVGVTKAIVEITIKARSDAWYYQAPMYFILQGSNDDSDWTDLGYYPQDSAWSSGQTRTFAVTASNSPPSKATDPDPTDDATAVAVDKTLSWSDGGGAASYDVYFGETSGSLTSIGNQAGTSYDPGGLDPETEYFWRIDAVNGNGTTTGDEWSFTTAAAGGGRKATQVVVIT